MLRSCLQSEKKGVFYGHQYFLILFFSYYIPWVWIMNMLFCLFSLTFWPFRLNFHSFFFCSFLALARPSCNIFREFQRIFKEGLNALFQCMTHVCMRRIQNRPQKGLFFYQNAKKTILFVSQLGSTKPNLAFIFIFGRSSLILS